MVGVLVGTGVCASALPTEITDRASDAENTRAKRLKWFLPKEI